MFVLFKPINPALKPDAARALWHTDHLAWLFYQWDQLTPVWGWAFIGGLAGILLLWVAGTLIPAFDPTAVIQWLAWMNSLIAIVNILAWIYVLIGSVV